MMLMDTGLGRLYESSCHANVTSDFIGPEIWPPNSPDLVNPMDYGIITVTNC